MFKYHLVVSFQGVSLTVVCCLGIVANLMAGLVLLRYQVNNGNDPGPGPQRFMNVFCTLFPSGDYC